MESLQLQTLNGLIMYQRGAFHSLDARWRPRVPGGALGRTVAILGNRLSKLFNPSRTSRKGLGAGKIKIYRTH